MRYLPIAPGYMQIKINPKLQTELNRAAAESSSMADEPISAEEYAAEIVESYMASRRLEKIAVGENFIDRAIPLVEHVLVNAKVISEAVQ